MNPSATKCAVITGAASGIGLATVEAMAETGTAVVGVDLAEAPQALSGVERLEWVQGDVTTQETWDEAVALSRRHDPRGPSSLISCAADVVVAPFLDTPLEDWRRLFEINVLGAIRGMTAVMPSMIERGRGSIAVVCSVDSLIVEEELSAYATSKAALLHAVRSAALEYARDGLRINAVAPGVVDTPLFRRHLDALDDPASAREALKRRTPTGEILEPAEIARVLRFLTSDEATGLSGSTVTVDGGLISTFDFDAFARSGPVRVDSSP